MTTARRARGRLGRLLAVAVAGGLALGLPTPAASAATSSTYDAVVAARLTARQATPLLGTALSGAVMDAASGRFTWSSNGMRMTLPASTAKLATAATALKVYGPSATFVTRARSGYGDGSVVLMGGGDPELTSTDLSILAARLVYARRAVPRQSVTVIVDDAMFGTPTASYGWQPGYQIADVSPVRSLVVDRHRSWDTSMDAGQAFARALAARGQPVRAVVRGRGPSTSTTLAYVTGRPLLSIVRTMLLESDNDHAEMLFRMVALRKGYSASWSGARAAQRAVLTSLGVPLGSSFQYDGSGLSRADRLNPAQLVLLLRASLSPSHPELASLRTLLPLAGRTGTLAARYDRYTTSPTSCAAGRLVGKTGSLSSVVTLAGFASGGDGRTKIYAFMVYGRPSTLATRQAVDRLASTLTGCW